VTLSLVFLTTRSPSKLGDELTLAGYRVFEALAISEVLYLQEHENIDAVIVGADVEEQEEKVRQLRGIVLALKPNATAADVQWELSSLFPERVKPIQ
jgi:hypothetical protein